MVTIFQSIPKRDPVKNTKYYSIRNRDPGQKAVKIDSFLQSDQNIEFRDRSYAQAALILPIP